VVQREREGRAQRGRVHDDVARAEHLDVWETEVPQRGGAREACAVEEPAGVGEGVDG
jgi:hypothetical protein